jgi:hypothetical protein
MAVFWFWLAVLLVIVALVAAPSWPHSRSWGYAPSSGALLGFLLILVLMWFGVIVAWWPWHGVHHFY